GKKCRLESEQEKFARRYFFFVGESECDRRLCGIEMRQQLLDHGGLRVRDLRPGADFLLQAVAPFLQRSEVGQNQLRVDDFDVAHRVDGAADVMDVAAFEAAYDLHDRVHCADVAAA